MKLILTFLLALFLKGSFPVEIPYQVIASGFETSDANKIVANGKDKILMKVLDKEGAYTKAQSTQILKDFFVKKPCTSFSYTAKSGQERNATAIGNYICKNESFRITLKWSKELNDYKIEFISIEKS